MKDYTDTANKDITPLSIQQQLTLNEIKVESSKVVSANLGCGKGRGF
jgi:hypothetical protein